MPEITTAQPKLIPAPLPLRAGWFRELTATDFLLVLGMIIWGTHYSIAKAAIDVVPPLIYNAFRYPLGMIAVGFIVKASGGNFRLPRSEWWPMIRVSFVTYVLYQWFFMNGLKNTFVANSVLITTSAPIGIVLINIWTKRERGTRRIYMGIVTALSGVLLVIVSRYAGQISFGGNTLLGDGLSIIAVFMWILSTLLMRRPLEVNPPLVTSFWFLFWGTIFGSIIAIPNLVTFDWSLVTPPIIAAILYSAFIAIGVAGTIWAFAIKRLGTSRSAIYLNLQPIVAATVAVLFLGEHFTVWLVIGTALVLVGMWRIRQG